MGDRVRTLDRWISSLGPTPNVIHCPTMQLRAFSDHDEPLLGGPGQIDIPTPQKMLWLMHATPRSVSDFVRRLNQARVDPYDRYNHFRLFATDYQGTEWACGWTAPAVQETSSTMWLVKGELSVISALAVGDAVSPISSVELVFQPPIALPMDLNMSSITTIAGEEIETRTSRGRHIVSLLGTKIEFTNSANNEHLWAVADTSEALSHPYLENWIAEPLRVLFGQLIYARLICRNTGDNRAHVSLRAVPRYKDRISIASLLGRDPFGARVDFWNLYEQLLTFIATARDEAGHPNFESNAVTRYFEEIIQSDNGSRWVLTLTLASVAEGLVKLQRGPSSAAPEFTPGQIKGMKDHVNAWAGDQKLRDRMISSVEFASKQSVGAYLRDRAKAGAIEKEEVEAWEKIRNAVMHGHLISPWSTAEDDQTIANLASLVRRLARNLISGAP